MTDTSTTKPEISGSLRLALDREVPAGSLARAGEWLPAGHTTAEKLGRDATRDIRRPQRDKGRYTQLKGD